MSISAVLSKTMERRYFDVAFHNKVKCFLVCFYISEVKMLHCYLAATIQTKTKDKD